MVIADLSPVCQLAHTTNHNSTYKLNVMKQAQNHIVKRQILAFT